MSVIVVSGSRTITDYQTVATVLERSGFDFTELVHGNQPGVNLRGIHYDTPDRLAARWAERNGIPVTPMDADWQKWGKAGGPVRNGEMVMYANRRAKELRTTSGFVAVWDGRSYGCADAITKARLYRLQICKAICFNGKIEFEFINYPEITQSYSMTLASVASS